MWLRNSLVVIFFAFACTGLFFLVLYSAEPESGFTLAELDEGRRYGFTDRIAASLGPALDKGAITLAGMELEGIFYGVLGICALALALGVAISVLQAVSERRRWSRPLAKSESVQSRQVTETASDSVVIPILAREAAPVERVSSDAAPAGATHGPVMRLRDQVPRTIHGPVAHMIFLFAGIVTAFGVLVAMLVYFRLSDSLSEQSLLRGRVTAANVSDGLGPLMLKKNAGAVRDLLRKHADRPGLAYILVEGLDQRILAHSFAVLPDDLAKAAAADPETRQNSRLLRIGDSDVYEVTAPILEGRGGTVRLGIWREQVDKEIRETMMPLMILLLSLTVSGSLLAMFLAWWINRPIFRLISAAKAISGGDLDTPTPNISDVGEFGELSRAIERLRSSVKAAMIRLSR